MSVGTQPRVKRFAVDYKGTRTFVNTTDYGRAVAFAYRKHLGEQGAKMQADPLGQFIADPDLGSIERFRKICVTKESLRY